MPQFEPVFKDLGGRLNAGAAIVLTLSGWFQENLSLFLGGCLIAALCVWLVLSKRERRVRIVAALSALPGIAGPMRDRRTAQIIGMLGLLIEHGVGCRRRSRSCATWSPTPATSPRSTGCTRRCATAAASPTRSPRPISCRRSRCACCGSATRPATCRAIAAHAAQFYEHKLGIGLDRLMGAIGPITIIVVSLVIGALIVSIMSALLSITELAL